jgi:hypothetical protein
MIDFSIVLENLLLFLKKCSYSLPTQKVMIIEVNQATLAETSSGRIKIHRVALRTPYEYQERFESIMKSGFSWVNVTCYGLDVDTLIVGIETPTPSPTRAVRTSINYSGPPTKVVQNDWDVSEAIIFE